MKCVFSSTFKSLRRCSIPKSIRVLLFSTETLKTDECSNSSLFSRISACGNPRVSMLPILDQWVQEGNSVEQQELDRAIRDVRSVKRYRHALEISEWMSERRNFVLSPGDIAIWLDLISKVRGSEAVENYFNEIPDELRSFQVYGALLNCYANINSLEKAEALMQKMMKLKLVRSILPNIVMLNLYRKMGKHNKVENLVQLMKNRGIPWDEYTLSIRLNAYADTPDIEAMEKLLMEMERDQQFHMTWNAYAIAARGDMKLA
ncbi:Pentatricopeptide repeat [Dillenia turbinata]|uniref:Pentatricopeptide repeat n=1 Tax=Dillenia turbinata TaxID=194707 RepID=A0AAN8UTW0_9MAGN